MLRPTAAVLVLTTASFGGWSDPQTRTAQPRGEDSGGTPFETASVTPSSVEQGRAGFRIQSEGRLTATNVTLKQLIEAAYKRHGFDRREIVNGPAWIDVDRFDLEAKAPGEHAFDRGQGGFPRQTLLMLRTLLTERFELRVRPERRDRPIYALVLRRDVTLGPRLRRSDVDCADAVLGKREPPGKAVCGVALYPGRLVGSSLTLPDLATVLSDSVDRMVVDRTGLEGSFDFEIEAVEFRPPGPFGPSYRPSDTKQSIFQALPEQLGLELQATNGSIEILVVEHAGKPAIRPPGI
jgi:uncharacterized protein (TIGR03435 family)